MKTSSKGKHKIVKKNKRKSSLEPDYSPYITFARGLAMLFNQTRVFTSQISRQGSKLASKSQFPFKSDSSPFLAIIKGLAGTVNELKKGVKYIVQLVENQVDKNESGPESEEWFYENTETPDTVEYFTEVKRKRKPTIPMGVIPKSIRRVRRKRKLEKARMEKLKKRKIGKKKKRRKKKH